MDELGMPLLQHLEELRQRLIRVVIAVTVGVIAGMAAAEPVLKVLIAPLEGNLPQALSPTEGPAVYFKVAVVIGVVIAMPVIMYQIFQFVAPGLESNEKRYVLVGAPVASLCFALGVAFAATVLLPAAIPFLNGFLGDIVEHRYSIDYYMSFVSNILLWAGLVFETPLVMFFLAKLGVVTPQGFAQARRIVIVGAAVGAAIITPTVDPVNMMLVMGPFLLLYELGILLARFA
ncbi:MAG: twin-arginine translocase subunit TatC [Chloroflexi bacterium]|nr:MAG: twin-arginine translocase subunit TatC [Chloroflexota bacterium]RLC82597.1 MAG: twin-arginine translocase subunit TatC [Chloroflexota bacterium]